MRLGIESVRHIGKQLAERIAAGRPYEGMDDVVRRNNLTEPQVEALATAGAFECFDVDRREALWAAGAVAQAKADRLPGVVVGAGAPPLPEMNDVEEAVADLWSTGISSTSYPTEFIRAVLDERGAVPARGLAALDDGVKVTVGGIVTHRQRPATAGGTVFVNLEDETGLINVICSKGLWARYRKVAQGSPALLIRGRLQKAEGVTNVVAERMESLALTVPASKARNFR